MQEPSLCVIPMFQIFPVAQMVKNLLAIMRPGFDPWVGKILLRREWLPTPVFLPGEFHEQRGAWQATVHGVTKSRTRLRNFHWVEIPRSILKLWDLGQVAQHLKDSVSLKGDTGITHFISFFNKFIF